MYVVLYSSVQPRVLSCFDEQCLLQSRNRNRDVYVAGSVFFCLELLPNATRTVFPLFAISPHDSQVRTFIFLGSKRLHKAFIRSSFFRNRGYVMVFTAT